MNWMIIPRDRSANKSVCLAIIPESGVIYSFALEDLYDGGWVFSVEIYSATVKHNNSTRIKLANIPARSLVTEQIEKILPELVKNICIKVHSPAPYIMDEAEIKMRFDAVLASQVDF